MALRATLLAAAAAAAAAAGCAAASEGEGSCGSDLQQDPTALMQLHVKVQQGIYEYPNPIGRTYLSEKPIASAEYMIRYYQATPAPLPDCGGSERAAVRLPQGLASASGFPPYAIFIKADPMPTGGDVDFKELEALLQETLAVAANGTLAYNFHLDDHEGVRSNVVNEAFARMVEDGLTVAGYHHPVEEARTFDALALIPHTLYTWQTHTSTSALGIAGVDQEDCRVNALTSMPGSWWKSTYSAQDPSEAAAFAINVLGATMLPTPYPPAEGNLDCTVAEWVALPGSGFNVHFVRAGGYQRYEEELESFTEGARSLRNLTAGVMDPFMYNSLMLRVPSLDPYIDRLRAHSLDFLLLSAGPGEFALFMDVPKNVITFQLRSTHVTAAEPQPSNAGCAFDFGPLSPP